MSMFLRPGLADDCLNANFGALNLLR